MPRSDKEHPAEQFLYEKGLIQRHSGPQRELLGCIGCKLAGPEAGSRDNFVYGRQLARCTGLLPGTVQPVLIRFENAEVIVREDEDETAAFNEGRPPRVLYRLSENELGAEFKRSLRIPDECGLETYDR